MTLADLVGQYFTPIGVPLSIIAPGYVSPHESSMCYSSAIRMGRAWNTPPSKSMLEKNKVGTRNFGLPPIIATLMQQLREKSVDPANPKHVEKFQTEMAQITQLITPLVLADAVQRKYPPSSDFSLECRIDHKSGTLSISYETLFFVEKLLGPRSRKTKTSRVTTIGGYHSVATIAPIAIEKIAMSQITPVNYIPSESRPLRVAFLAIHRGGILPSLVAADLVETLGCKTYVIGVDAKRKSEGGQAHGGKVIDIDLKKPNGYNPSSYSQLISDLYVFPREFEKPDILLAIDPMLATGGSSKKAIDGCINVLGMSPSDVYCVSFFAGGYGGLQRLHDAGFNVHIVAHDQLPLTPNDYIVPGLGDAGDKMSGIVSGQDVKDIYTLLRSMEHLVAKQALSIGRLEAYARQMTGREF